MTAKPRTKPAALQQPAPAAAADLSAAEARTLAVRASIGTGNTTNALDVLRRLGILQLDPLRRVDRAHRLTCLARMPATANAAAIDTDLWTPGPAQVFETWVHAACLLPAEDWPLLAAAPRTHPPPHQPAQRPSLRRGTHCSSPTTPPAPPSTNSNKPAPAPPAGTGPNTNAPPNTSSGPANSSAANAATTAASTTSPNAASPPNMLDAHRSREQILAAIAERGLAALGIATVQDVASYYHLLPADALEGLQLAGAQQVTVEGWTAPGWILHTDIPTAGELVAPRPTLIGPFDNLIFDRDRTRRVHHFDYTFEAYKPAAKRTYGHYVMAILNTAGNFAGRADLSREGSTVVALAQYAEEGVPPAELSQTLTAGLSVLNAQMSVEF